MGMMVPGIPGTLNLRHPVACQALIKAAADALSDLPTGRRPGLGCTSCQAWRDNTPSPVQIAPSGSSMRAG